MLEVVAGISFLNTIYIPKILSFLKNYNNYDYELFLLIYINKFYNENVNLIQETLDMFEIDKVRINNNLSN